MPPQDSVFRFGACVLDTRRGSLVRGNVEIELRPKSFSVLLFLVRNAGRLVPKGELVSVVWPDVVVTDDALTKCIGDIRAALADTDQTIVKTVPRRGYIFAEPVAESRAEPVTAASQPAVASTAGTVRKTAGRSFLSRRSVVSAAPLLVAVGGVSALWWSARVVSPAPGPASIAVLSFSGVEGDPGPQHLAQVCQLLTHSPVSSAANPHGCWGSLEK